MEVGSINSIPFQLPNIINNIPDRAIAREVELPVHISDKIEIDYEKVMMDPEEVKNFLFMLIGAEISKPSPQETKGSNINLLV